MKKVLSILVILMTFPLCVSAQQTDSPVLQDLRTMVASEVYNDPAAKALYNEKYNKRYNNSDAANIAGATVGGVASVIAIAQAIKEEKEYKKSVSLARQHIYEYKRDNALPGFKKNLVQMDSSYEKGRYQAALDYAYKCAKDNDTFNHELGNQLIIAAVIEDCYKRLGTTSDKSGIINNPKARLSDYSQYTTDIKNPKYIIKDTTCTALVTRVLCNDTETRVEMVYYNGLCSASSVTLKGTPYLKGKKSGKLQVTKIENIATAPDNTIIQYGGQTLKFALIFPAISTDDNVVELIVPSSTWKFKDLVCK